MATDVQLLTAILKQLVAIRAILEAGISSDVVAEVNTLTDSEVVKLG